MLQTTEDRLDRAFAVVGARTTKFAVTSLQTGCSQDRRQCGNTTRQVNFIIESLFSGFAVLCLDHQDRGGNIAANKALLDRVLRRLKAEHPGLVHPDFVEYNHLHSYIFLKEPTT